MITNTMLPMDDLSSVGSGSVDNVHGDGNRFCSCVPLSAMEPQSGPKRGRSWVVEDGAVVGSQDVPGNGGIILTDREFGDFEVVVEMRNDFGPDSGLFLRSTEDGKAYQAMIDYHTGGNLMGIHGEGLGGKPLITTWINGVKISEWTATEARHSARGRIALRIHGGGAPQDYAGKFVRYRGMRVREIVAGAER